jgi:hypothetical protein
VRKCRRAAKHSTAKSVGYRRSFRRKAVSGGYLALRSGCKPDAGAMESRHIVWRRTLSAALGFW